LHTVELMGATPPIYARSRDRWVRDRGCREIVHGGTYGQGQVTVEALVQQRILYETRKAPKIVREDGG
jgi:hypothetical protein